MLSKIKTMKLAISVKLTMIYATILTCILLFTSCLTFGGLLYVLLTQAHADLRQSVTNVTRYLDKADTIDNKVLEGNLLQAGVILKIYNDQDELVVDSDARALDAQAPSKTVNLRFGAFKAELSQLMDGTNYSYFYYAKDRISVNGHVFKLHFMKPMLEQNRFLKTLIAILLVTNVVGIGIAIISGIFISDRILRPIRKITETATEIEVRNLDKRIEETGSNDELCELAKTFNYMLNRIQKGFEKQRQFVADASHELRTPITVIHGYAEMLDSWGKKDSSALQEGIEAIKSEATNMYGLIEKLLFLARADQNRQILKKTLVNTKVLIDDVFQETCIIATSHKIVLAQNDAASIWGDFSSVKQMLRIFIENSMKYTPINGKITINAQKAGDCLDVTVKDTGIGIPDDDQPYVFNRFYRVDKSRSKFTGGTGLGLSIASWIAEQHDSTIHLESKLGKGTAITVKFPISLENPIGSKGRAL